MGRCISDDGPLAHILSVLDASLRSFQRLWPRRGHQERIMRAEVQQEAFLCLELDGLCEFEDLSRSDFVVGLSTSCRWALHSDDGPLAHILSVLDASFQWLWPRRGHQERIMRAEVQQEAFVCLELDGLCELEDLSRSDFVVGFSTSRRKALHFR